MTTPKIFVIGGTGAQGIPVVRGLVSDSKYAVRVLTRDPDSSRALELARSSNNIELFKGTLTSESDLRNGLNGCHGAFVNIDGFTVGEKAEMFWTARVFELAAELGVRHFVFGNLDYGLKKGNYNPRYRTGHYDGKGRMADWLLNQNSLNKTSREWEMSVSIFTTGPYMEMAVSARTPMAPTLETDEQGQEVVAWRVPLTESGAVPHVSLDDCGHYVRWLFDNPERADGMNLEVAIDHIHYKDLAAAFEKVTGHKARFIDVSFDEYWARQPLRAPSYRSASLEGDLSDPASMSIEENFTGFWNLWRDSGKNQGVIRRDYGFLDTVHPARIRTAEEFFVREDEKARLAGSSLFARVKEGCFILKLHEDMAR